ncbi:MAG: 3'-5' exonuclease [Elusimicrobia bacterium]|nr:3'-5' exonuclease [Elusimicrobiota bacterium]
MLTLDRPLCVFDLEATGTDPMQDRIVDVCVIRKEPGGAETSFSSLVNPGGPIPKEATAIHGITNAMVADAPRFEDLVPRLLDIFDGTDLAGFNAAKYDVPLLSCEFRRAGIEWPAPGRRILDSYVIFSRQERRDLTAAYKFYCGKALDGAHRAEADARATAEILWAQVERYADLPKNSAGLGAWCSQSYPDRVDAEGKFVWKAGEASFAFGNKHRGKTLREVAGADPGYLSWMIERGNFSPEVAALCREALSGKFPAKKS